MGVMCYQHGQHILYWLHAHVYILVSTEAQIICLHISMQQMRGHNTSSTYQMLANIQPINNSHIQSSLCIYAQTHTIQILSKYLHSHPCDMAQNGSFSERPFWVPDLRTTSTQVWLRGSQLQLHSWGCTQLVALQWQHTSLQSCVHVYCITNIKKHNTQQTTGSSTKHYIKPCVIYTAWDLTFPSQHIITAIFDVGCGCWNSLNTQKC